MGKGPFAEPYEIVTLRFTRVVFGVTSSPFLLNATIDTHIRKLETIEPAFVSKFLKSMYVDDLTTSIPDVDSAYAFYQRGLEKLLEAGFKLRKFMTNSVSLYTKLASKEVECMANDHKVLGVRWNPLRDVLIFDLEDIAREMEGATPTKRGVVSVATKFFDPLGILSPIIICFKVLFQKLCKVKLAWDDCLPEELLNDWTHLMNDIQAFKPLEIPRQHVVIDDVLTYSLRGFCDASQQAYAAVVFLVAEAASSKSVCLLCSKTRVAPLKTTTIPRLELLSALLLSRLLDAVTNALSPELTLDSPLCYTDSEIAFCWIRREEKEWKQFVQNRVIEIRNLVPASCWRHCPGIEYPADLPSRGVTLEKFRRNANLWFNGPPWLPAADYGDSVDDSIPVECIGELKKSHTVSLLVSTTVDSLIDCRKFSSLCELVRVMSIVRMFIRVLRSSTQPRRITASDRSRALNYLLRLSQSNLESLPKFASWKAQFRLYKDGDGLWRSKGRIQHSQLPSSTTDPIFLDKTHPLILLIIRYCHERVMHSGVTSTLTELRSKYWLVQGRQVIKKFIHTCVVCRKAGGHPYKGPPAPPLPSFRVTQVVPFAHTGLDFAGPLYVKDHSASEPRKVWLCLFTCCVVRAVHLDLVPDMTAESFLRCFRRFTSRRGFPLKLLSDNTKTFKASEKEISSTLSDPVVQRYFTDLSIDWRFNVEKAPW